MNFSEKLQIFHEKFHFLHAMGGKIRIPICIGYNGGYNVLIMAIIGSKLENFQ